MYGTRSVSDTLHLYVAIQFARYLVGMMSNFEPDYFFRFLDVFYQWHILRHPRTKRSHVDHTQVCKQVYSGMYTGIHPT